MRTNKPNLAALLAETGGSARHPEPAVIKQSAVAANATAGEAQGRAGTAPITIHFPKQVRDQLKILAVQNGATLHGPIAEAHNDLYAKYGKPEIAPAETAS